VLRGGQKCIERDFIFKTMVQVEIMPEAMVKQNLYHDPVQIVIPNINSLNNKEVFNEVQYHNGIPNVFGIIKKTRALGM